MYKDKYPPKEARGASWPQKLLVLIVGIAAGYVLGYVIMETADIMLASSAKHRELQATATGLPDQKQQQQVAQQQQQQQVGQQQTQQVEKQVVKVSEWPGDTMHSVLTSNGSPYQNFQTRIMYGTYKLVQKMPGGEKMTGFTRILHRMTEDELMNEVPTFRANPLHPACDEWCDFPVADRPNAVQQWIDFVQRNPPALQGAWVLFLECDYVWMKPMQAPDAHDPTVPGLQFHFDYIQPDHPDCSHIIERLAGGIPASEVPPSGPAPALIRFPDLVKVLPEYERITAAIEADAEAVKVLDWVREMYAWDISIAKNHVRMLTQEPRISPLIVQPPHDLGIGNASMCHYTWGALYHEDGKEIYRWEKRDYTAPEHALKVPLLKLPPPWKPGYKLQDGLPIGEELHNTIVAMLTQMNKAIEQLPDLGQPQRRLRRALKSMQMHMVPGSSDY